MLMTSGRREGALAIPSPGIGLSLNELSIPLRKNDYPITEFEAKWIFFAKASGGDSHGPRASGGDSHGSPELAGGEPRCRG